MKKVISLVLVVALFAALAVFASADVVPHDHTYDAWYNWMWDNGYCPGAPSTWPAVPERDKVNMWGWDGTRVFELGNVVVDDVKVLDITEGVKQTLTTCAQAITAAELQAACDSDERINNLTVFRQRNIEGAEGAVDISVKLWPCNPEKRPNQATVVLFRAEGTEEWTVVAYEAANEATAQLSGNGAYVVALAW